jgi:hypothetical protein
VQRGLTQHAAEPEKQIEKKKQKTKKGRGANLRKKSSQAAENSKVT